QNRGTQKTLLQKKKEKIIRQRILANPLTSQKTTFLW
ncbi:replication protein, partial [Escherichia coli]|nr:replication protein [Escherichia coli]